MIAVMLTLRAETRHIYSVHSMTEAPRRRSSFLLSNSSASPLTNPPNLSRLPTYHYVLSPLVKHTNKASAFLSSGYKGSGGGERKDS